MAQEVSGRDGAARPRVVRNSTIEGIAYGLIRDTGRLVPGRRSPASYDAWAAQTKDNAIND
jgi:hypothetical protein